MHLRRFERLLASQTEIKYLALSFHIHRYHYNAFAAISHINLEPAYPEFLPCPRSLALGLTASKVKGFEYAFPITELLFSRPNDKELFGNILAACIDDRRIPGTVAYRAEERCGFWPTVQLL